MFRKFKKIILPLICLLVIGFSLVSLSLPAVAADATSNKTGGTANSNLTGKDVDSPADSPEPLENPLKITNPIDLVGRIIFAILGLTGAIALVMFIWGGFQWMTAAGNSEKITNGRNTLMWAVLGLVIIFSSYAVLNAVLGILAD